MDTPERFSSLPEHAFPRLRGLLDAHPPGTTPISLAIGEPTHPFPDWVGGVLADSLAGLATYPANAGTPELRAAIAGWLGRRYGASLDPETQVMALNGTREGLFNAALALCPETKRGRRPAVLMPNPFYQVYAAAALAAGAEPVYLPATAETGFLPDFAALDAETLDRTAIAYLCSPANPQGAVADRERWAELLALAERHDFAVFADECYSEIYRETPPPGVLEVAAGQGADPERVLTFNSLSKRSNLPGLRSGFVAGGPDTIARLLQLRIFAGAPLPLPVQRVSEHAWSDETHVEANRALYARKYAMAEDIFADVPGAGPPEAGFFLWLPVADGEAAALTLWREAGIRVLPGAYLARTVASMNPGAGYLRLAMVAPEAEMQRALARTRACLFD